MRQGGVTDALVLAEVFTKLRTITNNQSAARKVVRNIMGSFTIVPVTADTVFEASKYDKLSITDAIHLVSSKEYKFISLDKDFDRYR